jgi:hypothetical protein
MRPSFRQFSAAADAQTKTPLNPAPEKPGANSGEMPTIKHDMVHFKTSTNPHPLNIAKVSNESQFMDRHVPHPIWTDSELQDLKITHHEFQGMGDRLAYMLVKFARTCFDTFSLYRFGKITPNKVLNRAIFLETVAGCPGMAGGMLRHLRSLRRMDHDHGWIHTLLEEAENERMHLLTFIKLKQPDLYFRTWVVIAQGVFMNAFTLAYMINPHFCHRFVGYLEEEAVHTYTSIIDHIDNGDLHEWGTKTPAPQIAIDYWRMSPDANLRDLFLNVKADEANHRDVNHTFASLPSRNAEASYLFDAQGKPLPPKATS